MTRSVVLSRTREVLQIPSPAVSTVEIARLTKRFGHLTVLDDISLRIPPGCITALIGPNAAGKTTLIKVILGLVRPDSGRILVNGSPVNGDPEYRARVGYMPQLARFPENLTAREVIAMLRDLRSSGPVDTELLQEFGLETELDQNVSTLSGGTRQKLNAAIAFLFKPRLLILDEPTAGLDPVASGILRDKIKRSAESGASVILSSHVLAELDELVDTVVFLSDGRVSYEGSLRHLKESTGQARLDRAVARLMRSERE
jgi:Cu-processing system ATP-binding protein